MTEEIKNLDAKVDDLEAAAKKYASKDTVVSIGGYEFTPAKLMVASLSYHQHSVVFMVRLKSTKTTKA